MTHSNNEKELNALIYSFRNYSGGVNRGRKHHPGRIMNSENWGCKFVVYGEPVPKQSFRVFEAKHGSKRGFVDPRVQAWETAVRLAARLAMAEQNQECLQTEAIEVEVEFHLGNSRRVDLDNLVKAVFDGMKWEVFRDDSQVMTLLAKKVVNANFQGVFVAVKKG